MLRALALASCLSGCGNIFDLDPVTRPMDAGADDSDGGDALDAALACFGGTSGGFVSVCFETAPDDPWLPVATIDTDSAQCEKVQPQTQTSNDPELCILSAANIAITTALNVHGSRPLVLVATNSLTLSSQLQVNSSRVGSRRGPGANAATCVPGHGFSGGGGAGGSHGTRGGDGGGGGAVAGGTSQVASMSPITTLDGGCPGGRGSAGADTGGDGGGAVYLIAAAQLLISGGTIDASGMAGLGGAAKVGGGGGGSGGMIVLDAPMITLTNAILIAHGVGGGGGGGDAGPGTPGSEVNYNDTTQYASPGGGGGGIRVGGGGGGGSNLTMAVGASGTTTATDGGGGGGGGHGVIRLFAAAVPMRTNSVISPASP